MSFARALRIALALLVASGSVWAAMQGRRPPTVRPLPLPATVHLTPEVAPGPRLQGLRHLGAPHPARAALTLGSETWIGTHSAGLLRYDARLWSDPGRARPVAVLDVQQGLPSPRIHDLAQDPSRPHELVVATARGLARVDRRHGRVRAVLLRGREVRALAFPLAGTNDGLYRIDGAHPRRIPGTAGLVVGQIVACGDRVLVSGSLPLLIHRDGWVEVRPDMSQTQALACCPDGTIWLGAHDGLRRLEPGSSRPRRAAWARHTPTLTCDGDGALLLGSFGEGAFRRVSGRDRLRRLLPRGRVSLLHAPDRGQVLVGSGEGLFVVGQRAVRLPLQGPPSGLVVALARRGTELWVGTFDGGLAVHDESGWHRVRLFDQRITQLLVGPRGRVWVGTASGLAVAAPGSRRATRVADPRGWLGRHVSLLRLHQRQIWVGVHPGLVTIDDSGFAYLGAQSHEADSGLVGPTVNGLAVTSAGTWAGGADGLSRLGPAGVFALTDLNAALPDNWINDIRAEGETVHVLTLSSGLLRLSTGGVVTLHTRGLMTSPSAMALLGDRPIYGVNGRGLALVDWRASPPRITTFGPAQGLASATVSALLHEVGADRLWLGGDAGVERIDHASQALAPQTKREEGT